MMKLRFFWNELNSSFWFIPSVLLLASVLAAFGFIHIDDASGFEPAGRWTFLFPGSADSARSILTTIATAAAGVAGTVFSITLVVLTPAASQLGARLLQNFMYDRLNQVVLGTYVATFV